MNVVGHGERDVEDVKAHCNETECPSSDPSEASFCRFGTNKNVTAKGTCGLTALFEICESRDCRNFLLDLDDSRSPIKWIT